MFPLVLDVEAPTNVIWWSLLRYYLFLGFAAGTVVTVWMLYWVVKYRERKDVKEVHVRFEVVSEATEQEGIR